MSKSVIPISLSVAVDDLSAVQPRPAPCEHTPTLMERLANRPSFQETTAKSLVISQKEREQPNACANFTILKLYGIPNCSTVKKARDWLTRHDIRVEFHDFKKNGLDAAIAENWLRQRDWSELINRKGLTWRGLTEEQKQQLTDSSSALTLMTEKTSVIKRPLLEQDGKLLHVGFDAAAYAQLFNLNGHDGDLP